MQECSRVFARVAILSFLSIAIAISARAGRNPDDKAILSRTAEVDGVQLHYLTAGQGPAVVILLHGYAETLRMWRPIPGKSGSPTGYEKRGEYYSRAGPQVRRGESASSGT